MGISPAVATSQTTIDAATKALCAKILDLETATLLLITHGTSTCTVNETKKSNLIFLILFLTSKGFMKLGSSYSKSTKISFSQSISELDS